MYMHIPSYFRLCNGLLHIAVPPSVEDVMEVLYGAALRWKDIAEGLGFTEDHIDEIYTNNETDVGCLRDVMEQWMRLGPTWDKLAQVLHDIGEDSLAQHAGGGGECRVSIHYMSIDRTTDKIHWEAPNTNHTTHTYIV